MPKQRVRRVAPMAGLTARAAVGRVGAALRRRLGNDEAVVAFHERNALRYAEALGGAKGVLMKAGQIASFVDPAGILGTEHWGPYRNALASLRTDVEPMAPELARAVVEAELGAPPEELFASFDDRAFAAASIGQVHRAVRHDGRAVAVKVQYPGAADAIAADLANVELLATAVRLARSVLPRMPRVDASAMAAELTQRFSEELDYRIELANLTEFAGYYADDPAIRIPAGHPDLSTSRVLTMDLAEGMGWAEALHAPQHLRDQWGGAVNRFFFRSIYRHAAFHADPHPGNYVFHDDGTVTILDFGCVSRFDEEALAGFVELSRATVAADAARLGAVFRGYGFVAADLGLSDQELLDFYRPTFQWVDEPQPFKITGEFTARVLNTINPYGPGGAVARQFTLPPAFLLTIRIYVGLYSVLAALEAQSDWRSGWEADVAYYLATRGRRLGDASPPGAAAVAGPAATG